MIAHTEIKLGEYLSTFELLENLIDVGKWVLVLYGLLVQWTVVDAKSVCSILQHITKKPSEIIYLNLRKSSVI